ncbi:No apical meristem (NAM) protein [Musa troglodytarum]|uniref:No apical meristem (NAM) protein n=1 Tax=Musa troglodytarum TaxID=320322 RepID=A0A9E7KWG1_9LILI|nr:No apical meristem (NAM) protein [Musa troglodytarum]
MEMGGRPSPPASLDPKAIPELPIKPSTRLALPSPPLPFLSTFLFPVLAPLLLLLLLFTLTRSAEESSRLILECKSARASCCCGVED